jgi:large subunit ribosomal protein L21
MSYAVIKTGGKQFVVTKGRTVRVPSIDAEVGKSVELDAMLSASDGDKNKPVVGAAKVSATVRDHGRDTKILVFKKKRRKQYKRKQGHRQGYTTITIDSIKQ